MADVQLKHGYVRIANQLFEAILDAEFTATQVRLLLGLVRLTYGWNRKTVTIGHSALARAVHLNPGGTFRGALRELVLEGVVLQLKPGFGDTPSTLAIQKDFTQWGRFSVSPARLARLYGERPESHDDLMPTAAPSDVGQPEGGASNQAGGAEGGAHLEAEGVPLNGQGVVPKVGTPTDAKSLVPQAEIERKDRKDRERQETEKADPTSDDAGAVDRPHAVARIVVMANKGLADHPQRPQPIPRILVGQASALDAAATMLDAGVPLAFAEATVYALAKAHRSETPINSLRYFADRVVVEWRRTCAARDAAAAETPAPVARSSAPSGRGRVLLDLFRRYDLVSYSGNASEWTAKLDRAAADPLAGPDFRTEVQRARPWDRISGDNDHFKALEIEQRLRAGIAA